MTAVGFAHRLGSDRIERLRNVSLALVAISLVKYASIAVRDVASAPHFFLVFLVLPFVVSAVLLTRQPRTAAVVYLLFGGLYALLMVQQLFGGIEDDYWGDYLLVYVGMPVAVVGLVLAVPVLVAGRPGRG